MGDEAVLKDTRTYCGGHLVLSDLGLSYGLTGTSRPNMIEITPDGQATSVRLTNGDVLEVQELPRVSVSVPPSPAPTNLANDCFDTKSQRWCEKRKSKCGKKQNIASSCRHTCGLCVTSPASTQAPPTLRPPPVADCVDMKSQKWCEKRTSKCEKNEEIASKCQHTCGLCKRRRLEYSPP